MYNLDKTNASKRKHILICLWLYYFAGLFFTGRRAISLHVNALNQSGEVTRKRQIKTVLTNIYKTFLIAK